MVFLDASEELHEGQRIADDHALVRMRARSVREEIATGVPWIAPS